MEKSVFIVSGVRITPDILISLKELLMLKFNQSNHPHQNSCPKPPIYTPPSAKKKKTDPPAASIYIHESRGVQRIGTIQTTAALWCGQKENESSSREEKLHVIMDHDAMCNGSPEKELCDASVWNMDKMTRATDKGAIATVGLFFFELHCMPGKVARIWRLFGFWNNWYIPCVRGSCINNGYWLIVCVCVFLSALQALVFAEMLRLRVKLVCDCYTTCVWPGFGCYYLQFTAMRKSSRDSRTK